MLIQNEMLTPKIETIPQKYFIGKSMKMNFAENRTVELWQSFVPRRKEIQNAIGKELYSMQIYPLDFFQHFDPSKEFEKMAMVEVDEMTKVPNEMIRIVLPTGLYSVFNYIGLPEQAENTFRFIFSEWIPKSIYKLDDRIHFEILGDKFKRDDPNSEEEIWIPIVTK